MSHTLTVKRDLQTALGLDASLSRGLDQMAPLQLNDPLQTSTPNFQHRHFLQTAQRENSHECLGELRRGVGESCSTGLNLTLAAAARDIEPRAKQNKTHPRRCEEFFHAGRTCHYVLTIQRPGRLPVNSGLAVHFKFMIELEKVELESTDHLYHSTC